VFLNATTGLIVEDVSGVKTINNIKKQFGEGEYKEVSFDELKETYQSDGKTLVKKTLIEANPQQAIEIKIAEEIRAMAIERLKNKGEL